MFNNKLFVYGDPEITVPAHLNFGKFILDRLRRMGDAVALENDETGEKLTYNEMTNYAVKLSTALTKLGVGKGDIVALGSEKRLMFIPTALAIIFSGAMFTPYDYKNGTAHLQHQMSITQPKHLICSYLFWKTNQTVIESLECIKSILTLDDAPQCFTSVNSLICSLEDIDVDLFEPAKVVGQIDTAMIYYSSGTTGMPKAVLLTHLNCILNSQILLVSDDSLKVAFVTGDWFYSYITNVTFTMLSLGKKIAYTNEKSPDKIIKALKQQQVNMIFVGPTVVHWLSEIEECETHDLRSLQIVYSAGASLPVKTMEKLKQNLPTIKCVVQGYGMTETGKLTRESWESQGRLGSVGRAVPGRTLKVVDTNTKEVLGPNQHGEICVRSPSLMKGYIGVDPSKYLDDEGFFATGDLGYYDEDGYFYLIDRIKDIIVYNVEKISPVELETILLRHPEVREAAVVGKKVPIYGEEPTAFVVRQPGSTITEQGLIDFIASKVAPYMELKGGVKFVPELPRNTRGKILRRRLREMLSETEFFRDFQN